LRLYEGAKDDVLLKAARHMTRGYGIVAAVIALLCLLARALGETRGVEALGLLFSAWLVLNLVFATSLSWLRSRKRLETGLILFLNLGTLILSAGDWFLGGSIWVATFALTLNFVFAALYLPPHASRRVIYPSLPFFAALVLAAACNWEPAHPLLASLLLKMEPIQRGYCALSFIATFSLIAVATEQISRGQEGRIKHLASANERLQALNGDLRDKHFALLCSQQDLILANEKLRLKSEEVLRSQDVIRTLAAAVEAKDNYTEGHSSRVAETALLLAEELNINPEEQMILKNGCILHDIGKINISDLILRKAGPLSKEEYEQMKRHPLIGEQICKPLAFARPFLDIIRHHHERMDGRGYPDGLCGEEISKLARIAAIADAWDAMTSDRPYRKALEPEEAFLRLRQGAGLQWDISFVEAFIPMMQRRIEQTSGEAIRA
jgi:putative nucleotidyltransferase with HDIG domain